MSRRLAHVVVDCADPEVLAAFWAAALGVGIDHRFEQYVFLTPTAEGGPALAFQRVPEPKVGKNRLHLDLVVDDLAAAVAELIALGARPVTSVDEEGGAPRGPGRSRGQRALRHPRRLTPIGRPPDRLTRGGAPGVRRSCGGRRRRWCWS